MARCTVERLMRGMGLHGAVRGRPVRTTVSDRKAPCPLDKVNRQFQAPRPNALWVVRLHLCRHLAGLRLLIRRDQQMNRPVLRRLEWLDPMIAGPEGGPSSDMQRYEG